MYDFTPGDPFGGDRPRAVFALAPVDPGSLGRTIGALADAFASAERSWTAATDIRPAEGFSVALDQLLTAAASVPANPIWASLTFRAGNASKASTLASTHPAATDADLAQYRTGQGPCVQALDLTDSALPVVCHDLTRDPRWAKFSQQVSRMDPQPRSVLSCPLMLPGPDRASLNLYAPVFGRWSDSADADLGRLIGHIVAAGLATLLQRRRAAHLELALDSNRMIGVAVGVLMTRHYWTYQEAFDRLLDVSQDTNRKLRVVAEEVAETGDLPV